MARSLPETSAVELRRLIGSRQLSPLELMDACMARIEALIEWVLPVAEEIGAAPYLAVPAANAAERQYERVAELGSHRDDVAELVRRPRERVGG